MKNFKRLFTIVLSMVLAAGMGCLSVFAADTDEFGESYKATYTISVYSGKEGTFGGDTVKKVEANYGDTVTVDIDGGITVAGSKKADLNFGMNSGSKYYARGLKVAGHDNDETSRMGYRTITSTATEDMSFSVAYGLEGGMVKYTVRYVDEDGNELHPTGEYYGVAGDYPVVSFKYVEGYAPDAYNLGKTLTGNDADNVFTFTYRESDLTAAEQQAAAAAPVTTVIRRGNANNANANANGNANANANNGAAGANNANGTTIGDNATPAAGAPNVVDLDNGEVPQAELPEEEESELAKQHTLGYILGGAGLVALIAAAAVALVKRRNAEYEDDEDEEDDDNN